MKQGRENEHTVVTDLRGGDVTLYFAVTMSETKNARGKRKVRVSVEECPKAKRQAGSVVAKVAARKPRQT